VKRVTVSSVFAPKQGYARTRGALSRYWRRWLHRLTSCQLAVEVGARDGCLRLTEHWTTDESL
jgi:hypothetical protein